MKIIIVLAALFMFGSCADDSIKSVDNSNELLLNVYPIPAKEYVGFKVFHTEYSIVSLTIENLTGDEIVILESGFKQSGSYDYVWDLRYNDKTIRDGLFIVHLQVGGRSLRKIFMVGEI